MMIVPEGKNPQEQATFLGFLFSFPSGFPFSRPTGYIPNRILFIQIQVGSWKANPKPNNENCGLDQGSSPCITTYWLGDQRLPPHCSGEDRTRIVEN